MSAYVQTRTQKTTFGRPMQVSRDTVERSTSQAEVFKKDFPLRCPDLRQHVMSPVLVAWPNLTLRAAPKSLTNVCQRPTYRVLQHVGRHATIYDGVKPEVSDLEEGYRLAAVGDGPNVFARLHPLASGTKRYQPYKEQRNTSERDSRLSWRGRWVAGWSALDSTVPYPRKYASSQTCKTTPLSTTKRDRTWRIWTSVWRTIQTKTAKRNAWCCESRCYKLGCTTRRRNPFLVLKKLPRVSQRRKLGRTHPKQGTLRVSA